MSGKSFRNNWDLDRNKYGVTIDIGHHETHSGNHYTTGAFASGYSNGNSLELLYRTPATGSMHATFLVATDKAALVTYYSCVGVTASGANVTSLNRNRQSGNTTDVYVGLGPTVTSYGTTMGAQWIGSSAFRSNLGGQARGTNEWILSKDTQYIFQVAPESSSNNRISVQFDWYEL